MELEKKKSDAVLKVKFLFARLSQLEKKGEEFAKEKREIIRELKSYGYKLGGD